MEYQLKEINDILLKLKKPENEGISDWIKNFDEYGGFSRCTNSKMNEVFKIAPPDNHSGCSYALLLRNVQSAIIDPKILEKTYNTDE